MLIIFTYCILFFLTLPCTVLNNCHIIQMLVKLLSHVIHRLYKVKTFFVDEKPVAVAVAFIGVLVLWLLISICRRFYKTVQISELWVYPVKGCRGQRVNSVMVTPKGLLHDRSFAIVNTTTGRVVTQRQEPRMALLSCGLRGFESLEMCMEGVVQVDDNILPLLRDKRLFTVARASPGEYADTNDSLDVDLDLDADSFMDSYISEGEDSVGAAAARVFFNSLNIPIMESALASYLRTLHDNPEYGRLAIEMQEQELRDQVRKKRATEATQGEEPPRPTESQFAALTGPLMLPSGKVDRSGFWRAREPTLPGSPEKSGSSGRKSPGGKGKDNGEFTLPIRKVLVWDEEIECVDCGDFAALWLAVVFPESAGNYRLVRMRDAHVRATPLHPLGGEVEEDSPEEVLRKKKASFGVAAMPDARPILLTNRASLDLLNKKLVRHSNTAKDSKPVSMARFRPNIVVDGAVAFAEDDWSSLVFPTMSALTFFAQPCRRCKVPTNDPDTGLFDEDGEPNTTLKTFHQGAHLGLVDPKAQREVSRLNK